MPYATRTIHDADSHVMETPDWLVPVCRSGIRARLRRCLVATVKPGEERFIDVLRAPARAIPADRAQGRGRDHAAQELERDGLVLQRGPPARARPARLREPARLQHLPQRLLRATSSTSDDLRSGLRRRARAQPRHASSSAPSTAGCWRSATCRWPTSTARRAMAAEAIAHGLQGAADAVGLPATATRRATRPVPGVGGGAGGGRADRVPRRRRRPAARSQLLQERLADGAPTSTAAPRTSARSTTWRSRIRRCRRWRR